MSPCIDLDCSSAVNCVICAMNSVSFCGFIGSWLVNWAKTSFRKSFWSSVRTGVRAEPGVKLESVRNELAAVICINSLDQAQDSQRRLAAGARATSLARMAEGAGMSSGSNSGDGREFSRSAVCRLDRLNPSSEDCPLKRDGDVSPSAPRRTPWLESDCCNSFQ